MQTTLTELRSDLYNKIDHLIETGEFIEIKRKGHTVRITSTKSSSKLSNMVDRKHVIKDQSDELINSDWLSIWNTENDFS